MRLYVLPFICIGANPSWSILNSRLVGDRMIVTPKIFIVEFGQESSHPSKGSWSILKQDSCFIIQKWRSYVTPRRASSSYKLHVHIFSHACSRIKSGSPMSLQHLILRKKTLEIKNVLASAPIFKKSWSLWTKAWFASSLLEQTLKNTSGEGPSNRSTIFVQPPTMTQPKETRGQTWSKASTQSEGELLRRKKKKKKIRRLPLLDHACKNFLIFSTYSSFYR